MNDTAYQLPADALSSIKNCDPCVISGAHAVWEKAHSAGDHAFLRQFATPTAYAAWCAEHYGNALATIRGTK